MSEPTYTELEEQANRMAGTLVVCTQEIERLRAALTDIQVQLDLNLADPESVRTIVNKGLEGAVSGSTRYTVVIRLSASDDDDARGFKDRLENWLSDNHSHRQTTVSLQTFRANLSISTALGGDKANDI